MKKSKRLILTLFLVLSLIMTMYGSAMAEDKLSVTDNTSIGEIYWVSTSGNDNNPGTEKEPFKTIQKAADIAMAGDTVKVMSGTYKETVTVKNTGTWFAPITFEAVSRFGAVISDKDSITLFQYNSVDETRYITLRGFWFKDTWVSSPYAKGTIMAAKGWRLEDCKFTDCGVGVLFRECDGDMDDTAVLRCIFENMKVNALWSYSGSPQIAMKNHIIKDTILRRNNTYNHDAGWHAGALKYLNTENLLVDGVISYDNNGSGFWMDYDNDKFTIQNSTFFGNHAGEYERNYSDFSVYSAAWAGAGLWTECNPGGKIINNYFYSNLAAGVGQMESGNKGGVDIIGNVFVENSEHIAFRGMARGEHYLGGGIVKDNLFKDWRGGTGAWNTNLEQTIEADTPGGHGINIDYNNYDSPKQKVFGEWVITLANGLDGLKTKLKSEVHGTSNPVEFAGPLIPVHDTTLEDVEKPSMWQVPSAQAEANDIDEVLENAGIGDTVTIPVTGRKSLTRAGDYWETEVYDLQTRYIRLVMDETQMAWVEKNVRPYGSIAQTSVTVKLTRKEPYYVEAVMGDVDIAAIKPVDDRILKTLAQYGWAKDAVEYLYSKGTIGTTYELGASITRADAMVMLINALDVKAEVDSSFSDVKPADYYYKAIGIAKKLGITNGTGNNMFRPNDLISRQDMLVLCAKAVKVAQKNLSTGTKEDLVKFSDADKVAGYAVEGVASLVRAGIINGTDKNMINPAGKMTRAEMLVIAYKILKKYF